jgi:hypothetical protein
MSLPKLDTFQVGSGLTRKHYIVLQRLDTYASNEENVLYHQHVTKLSFFVIDDQGKFLPKVILYRLI